jgi:hypothetical protein
MIELRSDRGGRDRLKGHFAGVVVETHLELVEHSRTAEKIRTDTEAFRETDRDIELCAANLNEQIVKENRNKTAIANYDHLPATVLPIDTHVVRLRGTDHTERSPRIHVDPDFMILDRDRDNRQQVAFVTRVSKFDSRHTISSSLGTRRTDGILSGWTARALVSTSRRESPTATNCSFTTATYLPAYFVTNSLKCSTTQRSSLSMIVSLYAFAVLYYRPFIVREQGMYL